MNALRGEFLGLTVESLVTRMSDGVAVADQDAVMRWVNPALCSLLATTADHIVDAPVTSLLTPSSCAVFEVAFAGRRRGDRTPYDLAWRRSDGAIVHTKVLPSPIFDEKGRFLGSFAVVSDRSEMDRLKDRLSIADRIVERSGTILYRARLTPDLPVEYVSHNIERLGYSPRDFVEDRVRFADIALQEDYPRVIAGLKQHIARGHREFTQRYRIRTTGGQTRWVDDRTILHRSDSNEAPYLEGIVTDVTAQVLAERERRQALVQTVRALAMTIAKRDAYTAEHQRRVADLSVEIGRQLGLHSERLEGLYLGALIHDVGKIAVPVEILTKPVTLSKAELDLVRSHAAVGREILKGVDLPWPIADMIGQHHERLDGSGYPRGLKGDEIIQEARIIAVADVLEAMSEHRPYRPALKVEAALTELTNRRGSQFDAAAVDSCCAIVQEHSNDTAQLWRALESDAVAGDLALKTDGGTVDDSRD